jgi:hypothetical protein
MEAKYFFRRKKNMKIRYLLLLAFISFSSFAQGVDHGNISFTISRMDIQVPIDSISYSQDNEITIRAFGYTTEPSSTIIILSIVLQRLSTDPQDLNLEKCWISLDHRNNFADDFYLSFGFEDFFAFYSSRTEQGGTVKKIQATSSSLFISKIEAIDNRIVLEGYFACSFINIHSGRIEPVEIQNAHFALVAMEAQTIATAAEENVSPSPFDPSILPPSSSAESSPIQSTSMEEEIFSDPGVPSQNQIQPSPNTSTPQPEYKQRTIGTGRGTLSNPRYTYRVPSTRENQEPADTTDDTARRKRR